MFARLGAVSLTMALIAGCGNSGSSSTEGGQPSAQGSGGSVTFVSWGGTTQDAQMKYWGKPFEEETGIKVVQDGPTDYGKFKAMVESGDVKWDVVDVEGDFAYQAAKDGLLEPLDFSVINKGDLDPDFVFDYGVGSFAYSFVNAYNTSKIKEKPQGWKDFFDQTAFPGDRTVYKWPTVGVLEMALLADGVEPSKLYPLDLDRAFRKLDELKPSIKWWQTGAQSQQLMANGEVSMGYVWNGRMYSLINDGAPVEIDWTQNIRTGDYLVVPKGAKNKEAAMKFIAHAVSVDAQAGFANETSYEPINVKSMGLVDSKLFPYLPSQHKESQVLLDVAYWAENKDKVIQQWNAWLLK
ncbi:ABC transporter substrate-binding protein [Brevibacillus massiliensis]|uniref:ABC transporter substrate-binding protein n=2 Tax=Brevibacillus massiliensis TaxID=1118054 RepID=UPI001C9CD16F|nr:ABC transporter substrate-binding protein [Brevibacillus massiliensis]